MTTRLIMRERIGREIRRPGLTTQINEAIATAVMVAQSDRLFFTESRGLTFSTAASQEFYSSSDDANIGRILKFDYVKINIGGTLFELRQMKPERIEALSDSGAQVGQPSGYCYYAEQIRLYPVPSEVFEVRIGAQINVAAPASDDETGNRWMSDGELLIRSRAKMELAIHVLRDQQLAADMAAIYGTEMDRLKRKTNQLVQQGGWRVEGDMC